MADPVARFARSLPFFYGWVIVGCAFVTMAVGVSARTAFSLLLPPVVEEFGWDRGTVAGAFSFGFLVSAGMSPFVGRAVDRHGPGLVVGVGVATVGTGMVLASFIQAAWQFYATLGLLVGIGSNMMGFTVQALYLPHWFRRRRGLAISIAYAGVGAGAILLLPWLQRVILHDGWRAACLAMGLVVLLVLGPLALLIRQRPERLGLEPDGGAAGEGAAARRAAIVDTAWAAREWTLRRAMRTTRFWWITLAYFGTLFVWYSVQVHQTKYLVEVGFSPEIAAWALGLVSLVAIPGQIGLGALSDRVGREVIYASGCLGFAICYAALIALEAGPSMPLLVLMVLAQGGLGYAVAAVMGPIVLEIFEGPHYGTIFGTITIASILGGATGPWLTGAVHDATGSYAAAFVVAMGMCGVSAAAVWMAAPRKVRVVPGQVRG